MHKEEKLKKVISDTTDDFGRKLVGGTWIKLIYVEVT